MHDNMIHCYTYKFTKYPPPPSESLSQIRYLLAKLSHFTIFNRFNPQDNILGHFALLLKVNKHQRTIWKCKMKDNFQLITWDPSASLAVVDSRSTWGYSRPLSFLIAVHERSFFAFFSESIWEISIEQLQSCKVVPCKVWHWIENSSIL